jgi:hypothetical protein
VSVAGVTGLTVTVGDAVLEGDLVVPEGATGVVLFAHGSGSSRHSPRNADSVPLPLLILAALALLMIAAGAGGLVTRRLRTGKIDTRAP